MSQADATMLFGWLYVSSKEKLSNWLECWPSVRLDTLGDAVGLVLGKKLDYMFFYKNV